MRENLVADTGWLLTAKPYSCSVSLPLFSTALTHYL